MGDAGFMDRRGPDHIAAIAANVGYQSEAAFNRAFKKYVGVPPGEWRRARTPARAES